MDVHRKVCDKQRARLTGLEQQDRALPMRAEREPVRLTDEAIAMALHVWAGADPDELDMEAWRDEADGIQMLEAARIIEAAVWAANGLEAAR